MSKAIAKSLGEFIDQASCPQQVVQALIDLGRQSGALDLSLDQAWRLKPGTSYIVPIYARSALYFSLPTLQDASLPLSFACAAAHTDSPCFRLKTNATIYDQGLLITGTEPYGGVIVGSWLDRPLKVAGTVVWRDPISKALKESLLEFPDLILSIPQLAIHFNREVNKGFEFNPQTQLRAFCPVVDTNGPAKAWERIAAARLFDSGLSASIPSTDDILALDLFLADRQGALLVDHDGQHLSAPRLDNLAGCHALSQAFWATKNAKHINVAFFFDHEEIGSQSLAGADSVLALRLLRRLFRCLLAHYVDEDQRLWEEHFDQALARSLLISVDAAHAQHPNFPDKHDAAYAPKLNQGLVLKHNVAHKYATQVSLAAWMRDFCSKHAIDLQDYTNRADMGCGSTLGPLLSSQLGMPALDCGIPLLAMHASREWAGSRDQEHCIRFLKAFYKEGTNEKKQTLHQSNRPS